jgi:glycosyltransferase involved in cell wall biosynthesis/MoaA/NifB/PqqE/SkfB family radical SAM enzyme
VRPLVSIIIPNRNGAATIDRCLEAALASRYGNFELIVVDDASEDDSLARIRRFPCRVVPLPRHGGAAHARNAGARASRGEMLFFTDADCLLEPDAVARAIERLRGSADLVVGGTYTLAACEPRFFDRFQSIFVHYFETKRAPQADYLAAHALALSASTFRRHGGFAESGLPILEDVEFSHRLRRAGCRLVMDPAIQARHVFGHTLGRSLRNGFRKARYWTCYSLGNRDLLADSGAASHELKLDVALWCLSVALIAAALVTGAFGWVAAAVAIQTVNAYASRGLLRVFHRTHGTAFAGAAMLYLLFVYPLAAGAGALAGLWMYLAREHRAPESSPMYSPLRHLGDLAWKRRPIQLTFFLTRRCNARCPFCFYLQSTDPAPAPGTELALDEIERLARPLGPLLWLAFSGGEVFLRQDLVEISRLFYVYNRPAIMLLPTNGLLPELIRERTERILAECPRSVIALKLSLDGVGSEHDALRATPGGFERVMQSYRLLAPLLARYPNFELGINTVFSARNQDRMDEIIDFVAGLPRPPAHTISLVRGRLRDPGYAKVDIGKYERAAGRLAARLRAGTGPTYRFRGARLKAAQDILQRGLIGRIHAAGARQTPCYAGRMNLVLSETGEVYPCEMRTETFGNVRAYGYDLRRVVRTAAARAELGAIARRECHCTNECHLMTNILFNPRCYPALAKEWLQLRPRRARSDGGAGGRVPALPTARTGS